MFGSDADESAGTTSTSRDAIDATTARLRIARATRRRPRGRVVLGGLLVAIAGTLVFTAAAGAGTTHGRSVVVAARAIPIGHRIEPADLEVRRLTVTDEGPGRLWSSPDPLLGAIAIASIGEGEFVQPSAIATDDGSASSPEITITVDRDHALNGELRSGETVDLLATYGTGNDAVTVTIAHDARVLRLEEIRSTAIGSTGRILVTLAVSTNDQVLDAVHAGNVATVTLVRTTAVDTAPSARNSTTGPLARSQAVR